MDITGTPAALADTGVAKLIVRSTAQIAGRQLVWINYTHMLWTGRAATAAHWVAVGDAVEGFDLHDDDRRRTFLADRRFTTKA